jgi:hypothetical protein
MSGLAAVDVAIGLILVFLVLSLLCSAANELIEAWVKHRAVDLERGIRELLNDPRGADFAKKVYSHPLISGMFVGTYDPADTTNLPSYIPSQTFALALMDLVLPADAGVPSGAAGAVPDAAALPAAAAALRAEAAKISNDQLKRALLTLIDAAGNDVAQARANIESWFNAGMDRVSGWYKRRKQKIIVAIGITVAILMNVSTITVAKSLWSNQTLRDSLAAAADKYVKATSDPQVTGKTPEAQLRAQMTELQSFGLPIGWTWEQNDPRSIKERDLGIWLERVLGWLLTGCAVSLGAPFWFDLLNKFVVVRSTVKPFEKSADEKSKD